jgi:antitoxin FitA
MGQIVIRNLDDAVLAALKRRAAQHRTSTEEEARRALAASVNAGVDAALARLDAARAMNGPQAGPASLELLRADRARDDGA